MLFTNKNNHRKGKIITTMLILSMVVFSIGCGNNDKTNTVQNEPQGYEHAVDMLNVLWEKSSQDFPAFGGNFDTSVENAPGSFSIEDKDTMSYTLLIPEDVQQYVTDVASLFHMMNANTFTAGAIKLDGMTAEDAAAKIKDSFKNNQFLCGIPDKIVIYTVGNDVVFFYGATDILEDFQKGIADLAGAKLFADENY